MAVIGKIYTYPENPRAYKALIAAKYTHAEIELPEFEFGKTNRTSEFLSKFPLGKVPAFEGRDGTNLCESNAIAYYIAASQSGSQLIARSPYEHAEMMQFISIFESYLVPPANVWVFSILGYVPFNAKNIEKAKADTKDILTILDKYLAHRTYFVGDRITLVDIIGVCSLLQPYKMVLEPSFRKPYINVNRWFETCINQSEFKAVIGEFRFCEKMAVYEPPKGAAPKKAEKPAPAVRRDEEDQDEEMAEEKPKKINPLDLLPPSSFNLEEWKRFYSNNETRPDALDFFWKKFDKEGFSIYSMEYKYNHELTKIFMTSNLVGGLFQRLEEARKYAFGTVCVLGKDHDNQIRGYFVFRGQDIPQEVRECDDFDSYSWTRVNPDDAEVRKEIDMYLAWDCPNFTEGKVFK